MTKRVKLNSREHLAMAVCKNLMAAGYSMGRRRIVSMQALEDAGLVERVIGNGLIVDWKLTEAGENWTEE